VSVQPGFEVAHFDPLAGCPADVRERAARIRLACFDVDGTLTDGRLYLDASGGETKAFHVRDGQGLALLRRAGIAVAFVTARPGAVAARRAAELGAECHAEVGDKLAFVQALALERNLRMAEVAFMGDDLADLAAMRGAGLAAAPADAHPLALGRRLLLHIADVMHSGEALPVVRPDASVSDALVEMSRKRLGMTAVVDDDGRLLGLYTDGDLRRSLDDAAIDLRSARIDRLMTRTPKVIGSDALAVEAARMMEAHKINALLVVDDALRVVGALNIHDLLRARVV
jgi:arabinose-5-phosphate isomerase